MIQRQTFRQGFLSTSQFDNTITELLSQDGGRGFEPRFTTDIVTRTFAFLDGCDSENYLDQ